jgi:hypothetical protein
MTNHVVLAGSVLAGVALWVGVYTALMPSHAPASSQAREARPSDIVPVAAMDREDLAPRRWVDFPNPASRPAAEAVERHGRLTTTATQEAVPLRQDGRPGLIHQTRRAGLTDAASTRRIVRDRSYGSRRARARMRYRRIPEPIQFSLATRSSS